MQGTVYRRLFERLTDLIPQLIQPVEGGQFVAPPRVVGDVASLCRVSNVSTTGCHLALSHGQPSATMPAPWLVLHVNLLTESAEVLAMAGPWHYDARVAEVAVALRSQVNVFAVNYLTAMMNLGGEFQATAAPAAAWA